MALKEKLSDGDFAVLEIIQDPIYLAEFLRSTNNGSVNRNTWPADQFEARYYQRMILTDKTENILLMGGRSIGKCQPLRSKIWTTEGYLSIQQLRKKPSFNVYAVNEQGELIIRRATITRDRRTPIYKITTNDGEVIECSGKHPILTDHGFVHASKLHVRDKIVTVHTLPSTHCVQHILSWAEARILGYLWGNVDPVNRRSRVTFIPRFKQIREELDIVAQEMLFKVRPRYKDVPDELVFEPFSGTRVRNQITSLLVELRLLDLTTRRRVFNLSWLHSHSLETIQTFLEAYLSQWATLARDEITIRCIGARQAKDFQTIFRLFGIHFDCTCTKPTTPFRYDISEWDLTTKTAYDARKIWTTFHMPGVALGNLRELPPPYECINNHLRYDYIKTIEILPLEPTFAVHVYQHENYITDNIVTHNSVVLEDLNIHYILNTDTEFPKTHEHLIATPNVNQLTPILDKIISRIRGSDLMESFIDQINRSKGTLDFKLYGGQHRMYARIAGSNNESNMVGLHIPKAMIDEVQLFNEAAYTQLLPAINTWEPNAQFLAAGVSNGNRSSVLYKLDQKSPQFKKYRIPAPQNPYYRIEDYERDLVRYRGEDSDEFQRLVLGRHGSATFVLITPDMIKREPFDFYSYKYNAAHVAQGREFKDVLQTPKIHISDVTLLAIDCGFADPTLIQLFVHDHGIWRLVVRWRLTRIDFPEQERIIDWIATYYNVSRIAIDVGSGGGGPGIVHSFFNRAEYASKEYDKRIIPISFGEKIVVGYDSREEPYEMITKVFAGGELVRRIQNSELILSEVDLEGINQLERLTKQRTASGYDRFFIMTDRGAVSEDDHIFSSFVCFIMGSLTAITLNKKPVRIARSSGVMSN